MNRIAEKIRNGKVLVSDGAWGTILQQKGLGPGECPEIQKDLGGHYRGRGHGVSRTKLFHNNKIFMGFEHLERGGVPIRFQHIPSPPRSLWYPQCPPLPFLG